MRRCADEHTITRQHQGAWHDEAILKNGALVHATITIRIFQHHDITHRFRFFDTVKIRHEAAHLHDPQPAVRTDLHGHRVLDQGITRDEFDAESGCDLK